jgi:chemotaxis signal transduction protein
MSVSVAGKESVVVFPLGDQRFALPTADVVELSRPGVIQTFPHTTPGVMGVLVRRGEVLPVWDLARALLGTDDATRKFFLVVRRNFAGSEPTALLISGECQMLNAEVMPPPEGAAAHARGLLWLEGEAVEVIDIGRLATPQGQRNRPTLEVGKEGEQA